MPHLSNTDSQITTVRASTANLKPQKSAPVRRFLLWSGAVLVALAILLNWTSLVVVLAGFAIAGLVWFCLKFRHDNQNLLPEGCPTGRWLISAFLGLVRFVPGLLILLVAFSMVFAVDQVVNWGLDHASRWAASSELIVIDRPIIVDRHRLSPWRLLGSETKVVIETVEVSKELGEATKFAVGTIINLLKLVLWYPWVVLSFFTLQCYFYFWARAFVARGGLVTLQFPKYQS